MYRLLPLFFCVGAGLEYLMIHWTVGPKKINFCEFSDHVMVGRGDNAVERITLELSVALLLIVRR